MNEDGEEMGERQRKRAIYKGKEKKKKRRRTVEKD